MTKRIRIPLSREVLVIRPPDHSLIDHSRLQSGQHHV